jgi:hypothetical protein
MSGARGSQSFEIRLGVSGGDAVEAALRRVQSTAGTVSTAVSTLGDNTGRAMQLVERGSQAAGDGLRALGGNFSALAPLIENTGGAVGRLVTGLGAGAGLLGTLGLVGGAISAAVALYQNWDAVSRAVGSAVDFLTGRVRLNEAAIGDANAALRAYLQLSETAAQAGNRRFIESQRQLGVAAEGRLPALEAEVSRLEGALAAARAGGGAGRVIARGGAAGLVPTDEFGRAADRALQDRLAQQRQAEALRLEGDLARARGALEGQRRIIAGTEGAIAGAVADQSNANPGRLVDPPAAAPAARGGGGGGRAASPTADALGAQRDAFLSANDPAARYAQTLSRIGELQGALEAAGREPLPDEVVIRATEAAMRDYERATAGATQATESLGQTSKDMQFAARGIGQALGGAFEDLVFNGEKAGDVIRSLERDLLRLGTRLLITQPLEQAFSGLFSGGSGGGGGGAAGGIGALVTSGAQYLSSLFFHEGGTVGMGGRAGPMMPAAVWAGAPRYHNGGMIGPDEVPAILRRGEVVRTPEQEAALGRRMGGVVVNINGVTDANSFRNSQGQITSRLAAALARTGRNR